MKQVRLFLCLLSGFLLTGSHVAWSLPMHWDPASQDGLSDWRWADVQRFHLPQARLVMREFKAPLPPAEAARRLSTAAGTRLSRLQFMGTELQLSGMDRQDHWLVQLRADRQGSAGLASVLSPLAARPMHFDPHRLAPAGARRVLQLSGASGRSASFSSFDCPGALAQIRASLRRTLLLEGWLPRETAIAETESLPSEWRHADGGDLTVHLHARAASTALTFWHRPKESP